MATFSDDFTTPGTSASVDLQLIVTVTSQSTELNRSTLSWTLRMKKGTAGYPSRNFNDCDAEAYVDGLVYEAGNLNYNFPGGPHTINVASGTKNVTHDADGTKTISVGGTYDGWSPLGYATFTENFTLPTIQRNVAYTEVDDAWELCLVYVGVNGAWVPARPHAGVDGAWVDTGA